MLASEVVIARLGVALLLTASLCIVAVLLGGCSVGTSKPKYIPPPITPTDSREADRIESALKTYRFDAGLVRQQAVSCRKGLPADLISKVCDQLLTPLHAQQRTHLRESAGALRSRVGPKCGAALERVFAVPVTRAGPPLATAAIVCRREYEAALR